MHPSSSSCSAITITSPVCPSAGATSFLFSTGLSKFGQLGINITDTPLIPQLADTISYNVKKVSVGLKHALFLTDTQKIIGVGDNTFGQLADTTNSGFPPLLSSLFSSKNTLLLATTNLGSVIYTADNLLLSVGFGSARGVVNTIQNVWKTLLAPLTPLTAISAGSNHVLLLSSLGSVYGVGDNTYGQIGSGNLLDFLVPAPLSSLLSTLLGLGEKIVSVVAGGNSSFMISSAGKLLAFGSNTFGQLCDGTTTSRGNSVAINVQGKSVKYVSGSESHTLIVTSDNTIYACGKGTDGQLGNGFFSDSKNPVVVNNALFNGKAIKKVVAAELFSLVLTEDNKLYSFGANTFGQLGDGTLLSKANPVEVNLKKLGGASICDVSAKIDMVMVVTCDGKVYTFGDSTGGKNAITSKIVSNTFDKSIKFASASDHVIYTGNDGKLYGYGRNDKGQLGDGSTLNRDLPVEISSMNGINITQIATGDSHTLILTSEGIVYSFGNNNVGQLGLGSTSSVNLPTQINMAALDTPIVTQIAAGSFHSLVLTSTGKLYSFGKNDKGQLGTGDLQDKTNPHPVDLSQLGGRTIISIYAGDTHSSFLTSDGTVFMFGPASGGQLCITGSSIVNIPQPISLNTNISQVALGTHTLLLSNDSVVYGCGSNENGELGVLSGNIKVQIPIPGNPVKIYASRGSTSFVKTSTGAVYGFGKNNFGQLGNGNYSNLFVPNLISTGHGQCLTLDNCLCSSCNMPICFGLTNNDQQVCSGKGICNAPNVCQCQMYYYGPICNVTQCYGTFSNDSSVCSGNGVCTGYNNCVCSGILFVAVDCSNTNTATTCYGKNSNDASVCSGKGVCSSNNNCTCNDGYLGSECQYQKIDTAFINFISDSFIGIENYTSFSIQIGLNNVPKYSKSFIYKYRINDLFNSITFDNNITFIMPNKGIYTLAVEIQVDDIIVGKATKTITVIDIQYALNNLDQLSLKAIMKIASDDNNFKENKSSLLKSLISTLQGKTINNVDDGTQLLTAYESLTKYTDELSSLTLNITNKMNEYCSFILDAKKNNLLTDEKASDSVSGVSNVLNNILAVNSTSDTHSTLLTSTESIVQTSLSLLSLSTSIQEKKIENKNIKILFYRPKNNLDNLNITVNGNYGFDIPSDILSQNNNNIAFGAVHYDVDNLFILPNSSSVLFNPSNHNTTSNVTVIATKISQFTTFINGNYVPLTNLTNPLTMTFEEFENVMDIDLKYFDVNTTYQCKYFDEKSQQWKGDGCYFVKSTFVNDKKILTCACTHTTSFTVFLEISTNLNTAMLQAQRRMSIAQIIISGIFIIFIGVIFISLLIQRKDNLIKSRYVTPHIGLISLLLKCIFVGIVANAVFTQSTEGDLFSVKITQSIKDANIISNAFVIVTCALTIIAITTYLLQNLRYLIVKYMYELIANNPKYQNKLLKSLSSFKVYITISITLFIATALYYILFVLLKNFSIISQDIFVYIISISYFTTILFISFLLFIIFIFDAYLSVKYKQYTNEFYDIINTTQTFSNNNENNVKSTNNNNNGKKGRRIYGVKHFYRDIYNYFIVNDTLLFRLELIIFFIGLIFFVASFIIGFLSIPTRFNSNTDNNNNPSTSTVNMIDIYNTVILATETVNVFCWILIFGGFTSFVAFIRFIKRKRNQKKKNKGINNPSQSVSSLNNNSNNSNSSTIVLDQQQQQQEEEESCEIEEILKNKHYYYLFKQYCKQEFSLENLYAFVEYHRFKNETNELKLLSQLKSFRDTYLVEGPMELNLPSKSKRLFLDFVTLLIEKNGRLEGIEKEWKNLLADVEYAILQNLGDTFSRFMLTEEFERLQKSMELTQQFEQHFDL
ncbi:hypothetical protein ABK040_001482 [Willaertia magna]